MFIDIAATLILLFWPLMLMTSAMMFDAPGSVNNRGTIISAMLILTYPVFLFLFFWLLDWRFWGIGGKQVFFVATIIVCSILVLFGYVRLLILNLRGISATGYSVAGDTVYYNGQPVEEAIAATFELLGNAQDRFERSSYAKDGRHVFFEGKVVAGANPEHFSRMETGGGDYWSDGDHVYHRGKPLEFAKPEGFHEIDNDYGWTKYLSAGAGYVYCSGERLEGADVNTFAILAGHLAKDHRKIFYRSHAILPDAKAAEFRLYPDSETYGHDNEKVYYICTEKHALTLSGVRPDDFAPLENRYAKSGSKVFYESRCGKFNEVLGADAPTFQVEHANSGMADAKDAKGYFRNGRRVAQEG